MAILTNSLGSTNQSIVHAAYARTRIPMLEAGLDVFEMRYEGAMKAELDTPPVVSRWVGLHAKCAVVDRKRVHIGSYNVTPRSANLNTELGLLIDSEALGEQLGALLDRAKAPENSWQLKLNEQGELRWLSSDGKLTRQPNQTFWRNIKSGLFGLFPLEQHL
jgi:putative cardiolipin synthase